MEQKNIKGQCYTNTTKQNGYIRTKREGRVAENLKGGKDE